MSVLRFDQTWEAGDCKVHLVVTGMGDLEDVWGDIQRLSLAAEQFADNRRQPSTPSQEREGSG